MAPLRDYICDYCGYEYTELHMSRDPEDYEFSTCRCGSKARVLPVLIGGYSGSTGGASTRPKNSTSMKKAKVYTGHPGNMGEPDEKQEEFNFNKKETKEKS